MTIFMTCPYNHCKARWQVRYSDKIGEQLTTNRDDAIAELRHRVNLMIKKDHREGRHKHGR
jgi:hypothetical protein